MKKYSNALKIGISAVFLSTVAVPNVSHGDFGAKIKRGSHKLRSQTAVLKDIVTEQTSVIQGVLSEKKTKIQTKVKQKKDKVVEIIHDQVERSPETIEKVTEKVQSGVQKTLKTVQKAAVIVRGEESTRISALQQKLDTTAQTLVKLDNLVSLEVILKMITLFNADTSFQFAKKQQGFGAVKIQLDKLLVQTEKDMADLRTNLTKKINANIAQISQSVAGKTAVQRQAQQTLEDDNTVMLGMIDSINALSDNALGFVRTLVARAAATKKETAQRDLTTMNAQIESSEEKLEAERAKLEQALQNPKFQEKMKDLIAKRNQVITDIASISTLYDQMMENDFFNFYEPQATSYGASLKTFSDGSGCNLDRDNYRVTSIQRCKETLISTLKTNDIENVTACTSLTPSADISDVEACITSFTGVPLTSFGKIIVKQ